MEDIAEGEADTTAISSLLKTSKGKALAKAVACNTYKTNTVSEERGVAVASALLTAMRDIIIIIDGNHKYSVVCQELNRI
jgi:hypothetical protein